MLRVVDSHHKALLAWSEFRGTLSKAPRLITLDHHTDTSSPFRRHIKEKLKRRYQCKGKISPSIQSDEFKSLQLKLLEKINFEDLNTVKEAIKYLNNDEHIVTAIKTDIISSAFVVAHNAIDTDLQTYTDHKIICKTVDEVISSDKRRRPNSDIVFESWFLQKALDRFSEIIFKSSFEKVKPLLLEGEYILDIDLDYLNTYKAVSPDDDFLIKDLIKKAGLVTIATEPDYVKSCAEEEGLTSDYLLEEVTKKFF